ncbi:MAG: DegT/DnrJ/EryC1/StrS family aminotransferase, partial [Pseudobdellovibrionaceae bacterium]
DIGSYSFSAPKIISTGQGGALVTNDDKLATKLRKIKDFGRTGGGLDIHDEIGFNFKFTDVQAAIGLEQMKKLPWRVKRKKEIHRIFEQRMSQTPEVEMLETNYEDAAPWFTDIFVSKPVELLNFLKEKNVGSRVMYPPINTQKCYNIVQDFPVTNRYALRGLWLPSSTKLTDDQVHYICDQVASFYRRKV